MEQIIKLIVKPKRSDHVPSNSHEVVEAKHPSDVIGNWGPVQRRILICVILIYMIGPLNNASIVFYHPKYDFYCHTHDPLTNTSISIKNACDYVVNNQTIQCTNFTYDDSLFKRTLVSEFDLVCSKSYYGSVAQSLHQFGYMLSGIGLGFISDRYGRRFAGKLAVCLEIFAGLGQAFAPSIYAFWFFRFLIGMSAYGRFLACYVLVSEWIGPNFRAKGIAMYEYGWHSGALLLPFLFHALPDYRIFQTAVTCWEILIFLPFLAFVWESPRWLLTHGKFDQADRNLVAAASARGKLDDKEIRRRIESIKQHTTKEVLSQGTNSQTVSDSWRDPQLRLLSIILYFSWFTMVFMYNAFALNQENLGGDLFINFFIFAVVDAVVNTALFLYIDHFDRRTMLQTSLVIQTVSLAFLFVTSFSDEYLVHRIIVSCFLRGGMSMAYVIIYLYTAETFPTSMRQASMGTCSIFGRIGSIISPFMKELTNATHLAVPTMIYVFFTLTNLLLIQFIPETGAIQMPDTIDQKKEQLDKDLAKRGSLSSRRDP